MKDGSNYLENIMYTKIMQKDTWRSMAACDSSSLKPGGRANLKSYGMERFRMHKSS